MTGTDLRRSTGICSTALLAFGLMMLLSIGCRQGAPHVDPAAGNAGAFGTISGTIRVPEGTSSVEGRAVEVMNIDTNERQRVTTSNVGGFTFRVRPGKYRVLVALQSGDSIVTQPGVIHVNRSDDAHADFVIEPVRVARPRHRLSTPLDPGARLSHRLARLARQARQARRT